MLPVRQVPLPAGGREVRDDDVRAASGGEVWALGGGVEACWAPQHEDRHPGLTVRRRFRSETSTNVGPVTSQDEDYLWRRGLGSAV